MKRYVFLIFFVFFGINLYAQGKNTSSTLSSTDTSENTNKNLIRTAADLKSGTSQDVLTSFFNLAFKDVSNGHHFQFNSSLFAVKAKTDSSLWVDTNYRRQVFARNFVFGIDYGLDSNYKFQSASVNVKYAIINNRDKSLFNTSIGKNLVNFQRSVSKIASLAEQKYFEKSNRTSQDTTLFNLVSNLIFYKKKSQQTPVNKLPERFKTILDSLLKKNNMPSIEHFAESRDSITNLFKVASSLLAQTSLLTVGSQVTANQQMLFNKTNFNAEYLKGITKNNTSMGLELDIQGNLDIFDTTAISKTYKRQVLSGSAGINWIIYKDKNTQKSYIEFKPALAYDNILSGLISGESKSKFTADGILRFRVTDNLWIPVDIKYDPQEGKVFGFINITSNFDWLGAAKSLSSSGN